MALHGEFEGHHRTSSQWVLDVAVNESGDLSLRMFGNTEKWGFPAGAWKFVKRLGDYDHYEVDFARRSKEKLGGKYHPFIPEAVDA